MKKKYLSVLLAGILAFSVFAGCSDKPEVPGPGGEDGVYQPTKREESEPIVFGIEGADGVFSPFFATAAYDSEINGQTQLSMLTSRVSSDGDDESVRIAYGDSEACVVKDLNISYLDSMNRVISSPTNAAYTQYDFLIKKGIKFSDGEDLTIDDVLFNLYVYLDPAYTGSATIYSTDIVGLSAYRTQSYDDNASDALDSQANNNANIRLERIYNWLINQYLLEMNGGQIPSGPIGGYYYTSGLESYEEEIEGDINFFLPLYNQEIENNYESAVSSFNEDRKSYKFDKGEYWQSYLYTYGLLTVETSLNKPVKELVMIDENGDYQPAPENPSEEEEDKIYEVYVFDFEDENRWVAEYINSYVESTCGANASQTEIDNAKRQAAIELVYSSTVGETNDAGEIVSWEYAGFANTILGSGCTSSLFTEILADERSKIISATAGDQIKSISGITTTKETSFTNSTGEYELDGEYDVLHIKINKVDPKAIWNFAFTVAPKHYYSPESEASAYVEDDHFLVNGVVYNSTDYMNNVLKSIERLRVPVGAGPYKASKFGGLGANEKYPGPNDFRDNNRIYYERNTYFDMVDGVKGGEIQNARIKYLQYVVVNSSFLLDSLSNNEIDVGTPNATNDNVNRLNKLSNLTSVMNKTNGYGYVGINAGKIPDVWMRRAIIKAMDTTTISEGYYSNGLCEIIYRPMSTESWAYPKNEAAKAPFAGTTMDGEYVDYIYDETGQEILAMLEEHGYEVSNNKVIKTPEGTAPQKITFTVAGESSDHPAWAMFKRAEEVLEGIGFEIDVKTDAFALNKLSKGELAVWAAAWSSTIDPDMYQVYHKDSQAGSTLNWGYREIKKDPVKYSYETMVMNELSELIDDAREVLDENTRAEIYAKALDLVMELAVEMPIYQRNDMTVYNNTKIDGKTLNQKPSAYDNLFSKIWEVGYVN